jgi:hypothetical protein
VLGIEAGRELIWKYSQEAMNQLVNSVRAEIHNHAAADGKCTD